LLTGVVVVVDEPMLSTGASAEGERPGIFKFIADLDPVGVATVGLIERMALMVVLWVSRSCSECPPDLTVYGCHRIGHHCPGRSRRSASRNVVAVGAGIWSVLQP